MTGRECHAIVGGSTPTSSDFFDSIYTACFKYSGTAIIEAFPTRIDSTCL